MQFFKDGNGSLCVEWEQAFGHKNVHGYSGSQIPLKTGRKLQKGVI